MNTPLRVPMAFCFAVACAFHLPAAEPLHTVGREAVIRTLPELHLLEPIWSSRVAWRESFALLQAKDDGPLLGRLAFSAAEIMTVKGANGEKVYQQGRDFRLAEDGLTLVFDKAAAAPFFKASDLFPPAGSPRSYAHRAGNPKQNVLYTSGRWFHDRQFEITYRRKPGEWPGHVPSLSEKSLPKTLARLRAGKPLTLSISGDSISAGADASALAKAPPNMPPYPDLVAAQLEASYKAPVTLRNRAVGGWSITHGLTDLDKLLTDKPNLIVVAYGMNDVGRRDPKWFTEQTAKLIARVQAADKEIEIILIAPMLGNAEWVHTPREVFPKYRDGLASLTGPGVALADLTAIWETLLKNKHDLDLIGNGLNHPCDFGHRVYAQTILALLVEKR